MVYIYNTTYIYKFFLEWTGSIPYSWLGHYILGMTPQVNFFWAGMWYKDLLRLLTASVALHNNMKQKHVLGLVIPDGSP